MGRLDINRIMVVEDDAALRRTLAESVADGKAEVVTCEDANSAVLQLESWSPDLLLLDVTLPDGDAFDVLEAVRRRKPMPVVVAISGTATPFQSFRLAELGVRTYVAKPFNLDELRQAIERAVSESPDLGPLLRNTVGKRSIHEVESEARSTMLDEAMARAGGSRRGAARLLHVSRQVIQHMLRRFGRGS